LPFEAMRRPAVPTAAIARTPMRFASSTMPCDGDHRALQRGVDDHALIREPLAQAGHLGAVDDGAPRPPVSRSPMWNLIELVPASITA
jgi:hypothetical protein